MKMTFIYLLRDPVTKEVRYIGKANDIKQRFRAHCNPARARNKNTHKFNWIKSLTRQGLRPELEIIEEVPIKAWKERERYWVKHYRKLGNKLTNATSGGDGLTMGNQTSFKVGQNGKPVVQLTLEGEYVKTYPSVRSAEKQFGVRTRIRHVCNGTRKTAKGFIWTYEEDYLKLTKEQIVAKSKKVKFKNSGQFKKGRKGTRNKAVKVYNFNDDITKEYESCRDSDIALGIPKGTTCVYASKGFTYKKTYKFSFI